MKWNVFIATWDTEWTAEQITTAAQHNLFYFSQKKFMISDSEIKKITTPEQIKHWAIRISEQKKNRQKQ